jgi:hypothetical protein
LNEGAQPNQQTNKKGGRKWEKTCPSNPLTCWKRVSLFFVCLVKEGDQLGHDTLFIFWIARAFFES